MSVYRTRNQTVLAKVEGTSGVDAVPVVGTDAVLVEAPAASPNLETVDTAEVTGALDSRPRIPAGGNRPFNCLVYLKGSGTGGTAPEYGSLLRACGMGEQLLAADEAGTAVAGDANSLTLAAGASAVDDFYRGMVITTAGGSAGAQTRVIASYDGTGKVATVYPAFSPAADGTETYTVHACALYKPASTSLVTATIYQYEHRSDGGDSRLNKVLGAAGSFTLEVPVRQPGRINFAMQGQLVSPEDVTNPGAATYQDVRPRPFLGAQSFLGGVAVKMNTTTFDLGATVNLIDNPSQEFGYDSAGITERRVSGRLNPPKELQSVRDAFDSWLNGTQAQLWNRWGSVAGNRVSIYNPGIVYTGVEDEDVNGFAHEGLPFDAVEENAGIFLCLY